MLRIKSVLLLLTTLLAAQLPMTAATVTYGVGACGQVGLTSFATISDALAATPGQTLITFGAGAFRPSLLMADQLPLRYSSTMQPVLSISPTSR